MSELENSINTCDDDNETRNPDGTLKIRNPNIMSMDDDFLYHLGFGTGSHDLPKMFGDVKFVVMGGTTNRMKAFAEFMMKEIGYELPLGAQLVDITASANRYAMYKVGPILSVSHGIGMSTLGVLMHELIKLMFYAKCQNPIFIRFGTSGGLGIEGGTVVVSNGAVDGLFREARVSLSLGRIVERPAILNAELANEIKSFADSSRDGFETVLGKTLGTDDFYEGQGRLDGAFCDYTKADKMAFLNKLRDMGVVNIEMEATLFASLTHHAGIKSAIVCVALLNRLNGDQVTTPKEVMNEWTKRPQDLIARFIKSRLGLQ